MKEEIINKRFEKHFNRYVDLKAISEVDKEILKWAKNILYEGYRTMYLQAMIDIENDRAKRSEG